MIPNATSPTSHGAIRAQSPANSSTEQVEGNLPINYFPEEEESNGVEESKDDIVQFSSPPPQIKITQGFFRFTKPDERMNLLNFGVFIKHQLVCSVDNTDKEQVTNLINQTLAELEEQICNDGLDLDFCSSCHEKLNDAGYNFDRDILWQLFHVAIGLFAASDTAGIDLNLLYNNDGGDISSENIDFDKAYKNLDNVIKVLSHNTNKTYYYEQNSLTEERTLTLSRKYNPENQKKQYYITTDLDKYCIAEQGIKQTDLSQDSKKLLIGKGGFGEVYKSADDELVKKKYFPRADNPRWSNIIPPEVIISNQAKMAEIIIAQDLYYFLPCVALPSKSGHREVMPYLNPLEYGEAFKLLVTQSRQLESIHNNAYGFDIPNTVIGEVFIQLNMLIEAGFCITDFSLQNTFLAKKNGEWKIGIIDSNGAIGNGGAMPITKNGKTLYLPSGPMNRMCTFIPNMSGNTLKDLKGVELVEGLRQLEMKEKQIIHYMRTLEFFQTPAAAQERMQLFGNTSAIATFVMITSGIPAWDFIVSCFLKCDTKESALDHDGLKQLLGKITSDDEQVTKFIDTLWQARQIYNGAKNKVEAIQQQVAQKRKREEEDARQKALDEGNALKRKSEENAREKALEEENAKLMEELMNLK